MPDSPPPNPSRPRPQVGLLALTLEFYETLAPALRAGREAWIRRDLIPALAPDCEVRFDGAVFRRDDIEVDVTPPEKSGHNVTQRSI